METNNKRLTEKYLKQLKRAIPKDYPRRSKILTDTRDNISAYLDEHPGMTYDTLCSEFGLPVELAVSLIDGLNGTDILRSFRKRKIIIAAVLFLAAAGIVTSLLVHRQMSQSTPSSVQNTVFVHDDTEER